MGAKKTRPPDPTACFKPRMIRKDAAIFEGLQSGVAKRKDWEIRTTQIRKGGARIGLPLSISARQSHLAEDGPWLKPSPSPPEQTVTSGTKRLRKSRLA